MAEHFSSSNPFRRKSAKPSDAVVVGDPGPGPFDSFTEMFAPIPLAQDGEKEHPKERQNVKPVKKVRVQSPPPSSPDEEMDRRRSLAALPQGHEGLQLRIANDPFEMMVSDASESTDEEPKPVKKSGAPANPFSKTLATLEHTDGEIHRIDSEPHTKVGGRAGRASMDVEAFQRLLMTGSAGPTEVKAPPAPQGPSTNTGVADGTSTETSSTSRQSIFENIQENIPESPRTSHEVSDPDEERRRISVVKAASLSDKKKPPPPSSRHGKLIRLELGNENWSASTPALLSSAPLSTESFSLGTTRSATDVNKPLPPAPSRLSHDSDHESIFDKEAAGKVPEPPSPPASIRRKTAPAPPSTRRHGAPVTDSKSPLSTYKLSSPSIEDEIRHSIAVAYPKTPVPPPPPPPSRRPASIRHSSFQPLSPPAFSSTSNDHDPPSQVSSETSSQLHSPHPPPPPPTRASSVRHANRPTSVYSLDMSTKRSSTVPPPPPPPRARTSSRASMESPTPNTAAPKASDDYFNVNGSLPAATEFLKQKERELRALERSHHQSPLPEAEEPDEAEAIRQELEAKERESQKHDILADITALQREVDALRGQYEKGAMSPP